MPQVMDTGYGEKLELFSGGEIEQLGEATLYKGMFSFGH